MPRYLKNGLTEQQQRFVDQYLIDLNGKQAAIRAGYSPRSAEMQASRMLSKAKVQRALEAGRKRIREKGEISAERVIEEYKRLAFANMEDYVRIVDGEPVIDLSNLTREQAAALSGADTLVTRTEGEEYSTTRKRTTLKFHSKQAALDALSKHLGLFKEEETEQKVRLEIVMFGEKADGDSSK